MTGSAQLDFYRYDGDSLQGRYHLLRLHPFSIAELGLGTNEALRDLLTLGGFPEPHLSASEIQARRWSRQSILSQYTRRRFEAADPAMRAVTQGARDEAG